MCNLASYAAGTNLNAIIGLADDVNCFINEAGVLGSPSAATDLRALAKTWPCGVVVGSQKSSQATKSS